MTTKTWNGSNADWYANSGGDWSPAGDPGATDDVVIGGGTVTLTGGDAGITVNSITLSGTSVLQIHDPGATQSVAGNVTNSGSLDIDTTGGGGSSLAIGGTLANTGTLNIGNGFLTAPTTVTAAGLSNTGTINIDGSSTEQAALEVGAAAPASWTGTATLSGGALLQFTGTSQIGAIASGAEISLSGAKAFVASAGINSTSNSALTGLTTVAGDLFLANGASLSPTGDLGITGAVELDAATNGAGGTSLTVGGALNNTGGTFDIGDTSLTAADTVTVQGASGLVNGNTCVINIVGSASVLASLDVTNAAAGFGTAGVETGTVFLENDALLEFASGQITTIDGTLELVGTNALVADSGATTTNSALTGLTNVVGHFILQNGASVNPSGNLTISGGAAVEVGAAGIVTGGSSLTIGGTLTNSGALDIGTPNTLAADTVTVQGGLSDSGGIALKSGGSTTASADLDVSGNVSITGTGSLALDGAGVGGRGGSSLTVGGALTNSGGYLDIGNPNVTAADTVTVLGAGGLSNGTGSEITIESSTSALASLNITNAAAGFGTAGVETGTVLLENDALLEFASGQITTIDGTLELAGTSARVADSGATGTNSALTGLTDVAGTFILLNGASVSPSGDLSNTGVVYLDEGFNGRGGTTLTIGGALTNTGALNVGGPDVVAADTVTVQGAGGLSNSGTIELLGNRSTTASANLVVSDDLSITGTGSLALDVIGFLGGGANLTVGGTLTNSGTFDIGSAGITAADTARVQGAGGLSNTGNIDMVGGSATATATLQVTGNVTTSGTVIVGNFADLVTPNIDVTGGTLEFTSAITAASGTGNFEIGGNGTVELGGAVDAGHSITFTSTAGTMELGAPGQFAPTVDGFVVGDKIDLLKTAVTGLSYASGLLTVTNGATIVASLNIAGSYSTGDFAFASDGSGGTDIELTHNPATLSITAPPTATVGVGQPDPIAGTGISESPSTPGETFTVTLNDGHGVLAATGGTPSNGGETLTVSGALTQVNADLVTLTDTDATTPSDTITISASDSNGVTATPEQIEVTVNGPPVIAAPASAAVAMSRATAIHGVSLSETGNMSGERFTVTLVGTNGDLSASGTGVSGAGTTSLTITGSVSQVNADLATLTDTENTPASNTITLDASDSLGNAASQKQIAVTVNGPLVVTAPAAATVNQSQATPISGISLSESGNTSGETFTVTLSDTNGLLSATGPGVSGAGTTRLTITGSLGRVDNDLTTLTDTDPTFASETITVEASDSLGNQATSQSIGVTVQPLTLGGLEGIAAVNGVQVIDWPSLEASLRPAFIDTTDWNLIWERYEADVGTTTTRLINALLPVATAQSQINPTLVGPLQIDVSTLLTEVLEEASGVLPNIILADTTDLAPAGTGFDLLLTRTYSASFLNRNDPGPFGDGWTFTYGISAVTDASGNVYITLPSGTELFTLQSNGSYTAQPGDPSKLTKSVGAYVLTGINGTVERFLPNGQISNITDSNGNTINVSYGSNGVISGVTSSNGQSLTFTPNAQGRITRATDNSGQTTTYTYDASGDHLLSVSGPAEVTTYSYDSSGNPFVQNALTQITNPDGTTQNFAYDSQGDLISQSGNGGVGQQTYRYPSAGTLTAMDAAGNAATLIFDTNGNLAEITDPLGNVTHYQYNSSNELTGVKTPTGATFAFNYDSTGNLTGYTDPDDGTVSAAYRSGTDLLTSFSDQDGNTTNYSYNSAGDLTGITYDNGSGTSYQYSPSGLLISSTDARGQTTTYTYNPQGLLTRETFSDGTFQAYTYNSLGELISAQATNGGVTTYAYTAAGELTSVINPASQVESYTYNAGGQELTRTESDGSVTRYSYTPAGELAEIEDGSGNLITQYSYNALGELVGSLDGNGQTTSYTYDADGNVTQILTKAADGTVTSQLNYTYNADGHPIAATSLDGTWTYTYDASGQLTNAVFASTNPPSLIRTSPTNTTPQAIASKRSSTARSTTTRPTASTSTHPATVRPTITMPTAISSA